VHAEGTPQQGICFAVAADGVKLARNRERMVLGHIDRQAAAGVGNSLVLYDPILHAGPSTLQRIFTISAGGVHVKR